MTDSLPRSLVSTQVPLVMPLEDSGAVSSVAGGKGASLARLARAGFRIPPGFHVTAGAYADFVGRYGLGESVLAVMSVVRAADPATFDVAAARIRCRRQEYCSTASAGRSAPDAPLSGVVGPSVSSS
jgi:Pyruvate phosphate dikinase, AMP/ATP-binding domain